MTTATKKPSAKAFDKVVMPGTVEAGYPARRVPVFVRIKYSEDGRLSLTGVVGPKSNGDCLGSCGQCVDVLSEPGFESNKDQGWGLTPFANARRLREIWDRWHLNDMRAACEHQRAAGWTEKAAQKVTLYHWRMTDEASKKQKKAEADAMAALKAGRVFKPLPWASKYAAMPYALTTPTPDAPSEDYEAKRPLWAGDKGPTEEKTLGWLYPPEAANGGTIDGEDVHPDGLLCRPCPSCGYKYGSKWLREDVPGEVLDWLRALPET